LLNRRTRELKPMLAGKADLKRLQYPVLLSPKLDGIRAIVKGGVVLSRSLKPIPNKYVQKLLGKARYEGLDGELILGDPTDKAVYRKTNSAVMSHDGEPGFTFFAFDLWDMDAPFKQRLSILESHYNSIYDPLIMVVPHAEVRTEKDLLEYEQLYLDRGYEGVMLRDPMGLYKQGRSTTKEGTLLKLKRFTDAEAEIIGFEELMHNANEAKTNALGRTERSSHKAGLVPTGSLGAFVCKDLGTGVEFNIGTGFTEAQRRLYWSIKQDLTGRIAKYKFFDVGVKDAPRHPVFIGFRDKLDMDGEAV
jgi:DNA ligase-1